MRKQDILPPARVLPGEGHAHATSTIVPPRSNPGGILDGWFMRAEAKQQTETFGALVARTVAETELFEKQKDMVAAYGRRQRELAELHELPEILAAERATRRAERAETLRQAQHRYEIGEAKRLTELAQFEAALVDARQALQAQREYGYTTYQLAWRKKYCDLLDVELGAAERLAILRQHDASLAKALKSTPALPAAIADEAIEEALHVQQSELAASGLDTGRVDSLIERRKARK